MEFKMQEQMIEKEQQRAITDKIKLSDGHEVYIPEISFKKLNEA
jgi:phosphopantothenoylcysteine synthetase/decarboxylase